MKKTFWIPRYTTVTIALTSITVPLCVISYKPNYPHLFIEEAMYRIEIVLLDNDETLALVKYYDATIAIFSKDPDTNHYIKLHYDGRDGLNAVNYPNGDSFIWIEMPIF